MIKKAIESGEIGRKFNKRLENNEKRKESGPFQAERRRMF